MAAQELYSTQLFSDSSLVGYYRAENANDSKGSNNLTNNGTTPFNSAKFNNGFDFGASNSSKYMSIASGLGVDLSGAYSVSFWFKCATEPTSGTFPRLIDWRSTTGTTRYAIINYSNPSGTKQLDVDISGGTGSYSVTLGTSDFHNIILTCSAGGSAKLYLDNVQVATATRSTSTSTNNLAIGAAVGGSLFSSGIIDDVAFFSKELSASEVNSIYTGVFDSGFFTHISL